MATIADLSVTIDDGKTSVVPGVNYDILGFSGAHTNTYTITVTNNGPDTVTQFNLNFVRGPGLSWNGTIFGFGAGDGFQSSVSGVDLYLWSGLTLASGQSATTYFNYSIDPSATSPVTLTATVIAPAGTTDPDATNNSSTDSDTATPQADLAVAVTDGKTTVVPGTSNTYTITVTNNGPSTVSSLTLTDTIPAALLNSSFTPSVGAYDSVTGLWSGLSLASGQNVTMTLTGTIDPNATGSLSNTVTVAPPSGTTDSNSANDSFTDNDTLTPQADLAVTMTDGVTTVAPGASITYTITVTNNGPSMVDALVTDLFPADFTNVLWFVVLNSGAISASPAGAFGDINNATAKLLPGGSVTFRASGQISASATGPLANTVTVTTPAGTTDPTPGNNSVTDTDTLLVDLAVTMDDGKTVVTPGTSNTYTITVTNNGPSTVTSLALTDSIPATLLNSSFTPSVGTYDPNTGVWSGLSLASGQNVTMTLTGTIDPNATGSLSNTVTVAAPAGTTDTNPGNNSFTDTDTLTPQADLAVTIDDSKTSAVPGASNTYIITVTNNGPSTAVGAAVTDLFPADFTNVTWTTTVSGGSSVLAPSGNGNILTTATLLSGGTVTFTAVGQITASATGTLTNTVTVSSPAGSFDPNPTNNAATDTDALALPSDLAVTITDAATTLVPGTVDTYTITVTNNGPSTVSSFNLVDTIPGALLNATFGSPSAGSYDAGSGLWSGLNLASGQSVSITRSGVIGITSGTLSNTVTVSLPAGMADTNPGNNAATDSDTLILFSSPYPPAPSATSAHMVLRRGDGLYAIYDIGSNASLAAHPLAQVGADWQFAGLGSVQAGGGTAMFLRQQNGLGATGSFGIYNISNNNIVSAAMLGQLDGQALGFGNFGSRGENDVLLRNGTAFSVANIANDQITGTVPLGSIGLNWQLAGFGDFSGNPGEYDMLLRDANSGGLQVYDIASNRITNSAFMGAVGLDWQVSGFGGFGTRPGETDMLLRNVNTGGLQVYDIANNQITNSAFLGTVGLEWQFAGVAPVRGAGSSDLVLRNVNTGAFEAYNIANNQIIGAASLGQVGLEWQLGGFAADPAAASGSLGSTAQLVQAMAGFGGSGAANGFNVAALGADASQQALLTQPHA
jgi:uncharacterized repeat protein (TIGR01451 family)